MPPKKIAKKAPPPPPAPLQVHKILDIQFDNGKQYLVQPADADTAPRWIRQRRLQHVPDLIDAFHTAEQRELDNILASDLLPDRIVGFVRANKATGAEAQFLIKWHNHAENQIHLVKASKVYEASPQLAIEYFQSRLLCPEVDKNSANLVSDAEPYLAQQNDPKPYTEVEQNANPVEILGAIYEGNQLMFLMRWEDTKQTDFVLADDANEKCPLIVLQFYTNRLKPSAM